MTIVSVRGACRSGSSVFFSLNVTTFQNISPRQKGLQKPHEPFLDRHNMRVIERRAQPKIGLFNYQTANLYASYSMLYCDSAEIPHTFLAQQVHVIIDWTMFPGWFDRLQLEWDQHGSYTHIIIKTWLIHKKPFPIKSVRCCHCSCVHQTLKEKLCMLLGQSLLFPLCKQWGVILADLANSLWSVLLSAVPLESQSKEAIALSLV